MSKIRSEIESKLSRNGSKNMMYDIVKYQKSYIYDCKCICIFRFFMIELVERIIRSINFGFVVIGWFIKLKDYNKNKFFKFRSERYKVIL